MDLNHRQRAWIMIGLVMIGFIGVLFFDPVPQDPNYHLFADNRTILGIPNFYNVASNVFFALVGGLGGLALIQWSDRKDFMCGSEIWPYAVFFLGVGLVTLGSAYYHWEPSNETLLWDRLPMSVAFMALSSAVVADRINGPAGNTWLLFLLVTLGLLSLVYWHWTESAGRGDLRFYGFLQFYPVALLPIVLWLFPDHRFTSGRYIIWVIAWYAAAKALEYFDREIFAVTGNTVSGHALKHLAAAMAAFVVLRMLEAQRIRLARAIDSAPMG
jgi:hypothetical protein